MRLVVNLVNVSVITLRNSLLANLNWQIRKGESWAVIGPNGAGKTTLLKLINGYQRSSEGEVSILGNDLHNVDVRELRKKIGFVGPYIEQLIPQEEDILRIVLSGKYATLGLWDRPPREDFKYAQRLIRLIDCENCQGKRFGDLSQGEKQRIIIARALMSKPRMLTLDEACAGLDLKAREHLLAVLSTLTKEKDVTMIFVTQRIDEIPRNFTHALLLKEGAIIAQGAVEKVLTDDNLSHCFDVRVKVEKWQGRLYSLIDSRASRHQRESHSYE